MPVADALKLTCATCGQANRVPASRLGDAPKCGVCGAVLVDGSVAELDAAAHDKVTRGDGLPVLVDYWAPWCGPCRMMAPEFAKAAKALTGQARLMKLNTEDHPEVSARAGILHGVPAQIAARLKPLIAEVVIAPALATTPWLAPALRVL